MKNHDRRSGGTRAALLLGALLVLCARGPALAQQPPSVPDPNAADPQFRDPFSVPVHLRAANPAVTLYRTSGQVAGYYNNFGGRGRGQVAGATENRQALCTVPCGVPVERMGLYVVGGPGLAFSRRFRIPPEAGEAWVDVKPGSKRLHAAAIAPIVVGAVNLALGFVFLAQSGRLQDRLDNPSPIQAPVNPADVTRFRNLGIGFTVGGGAVLIGGILWRVFSGTRILVQQRPGNWLSKHLGPGVLVF